MQPASRVALVALAIMLAGCAAPATEPRALEPASDPAPAGAAPGSPAPSAPSPGAVLRVHVVDVGQGDGVVWQLPDGAFAVYDCGPPARAGAEHPMVARLRSLGLPRGGAIHALIASHGHLDHIGGCGAILQEYRVLHLYDAWYEGRDAPASYARFRDQVRTEGGVVHVLAETSALEGEVVFRAGDQVDLPPTARSAGVSAEILWPPAFQGRDWDAIQDSSIAVRLSLGQVDSCFAGDLEKRQEAALAQRFMGKDCEVYLVGHHGSNDSSSAPWLAAMDPEVAVASFGENPYEHPRSEAMCRVKQAGARVYATERVGTVSVETDGTRVTVSPDRADAKDYCAPGADYWR